MTVEKDAGVSLAGERWERRAAIVASALAIAAALFHVVILLRIFASRLSFPMDIEWLEGHALEEAWRTTHTGDLTYGDPSAGYQTQIYTPFYFALTGVVGRVVGLDYATGRAISIVAFLAGCVAAFWPIANRRPDRSLAVSLGLVAVGAVCASYAAVFGWYDLARVDSLAIALIVVAAAILGGESPSVARVVLVGLVLAAAVFTKQTNVLFVPWFVLFVFGQKRREGIVLALAFGGACLVAFASLQLATHGWFWRWMTLATKQTLVVSRLREGAEMLWRFAPYMPALVIVLPILIVKRWASKTTVLWAGLFACSLPSGILPLIKAGGAANNLIPIVAIAPVIACLAIFDLLDRTSPAARAWWSPVTLVACAAYLVSVRYPATPYLPTDAQWAGARALNAFVASREGGVVIPSHPFLARRNHAAGRQLMTMGYLEFVMAGRASTIDIAGDLERIGPQWVILAEPGPDDWMRASLRSGFSPFCRIEPSYGTYGSLMSDPRLVYRARPHDGGNTRQPGVELYPAIHLAGAPRRVDEGDSPKVIGDAGSFALGPLTHARACADSVPACRDYTAGAVVDDVVAELGGSLSALFVAFDWPSCE